MGAILTSTDAMGEWGVEVRRESFYVNDPTGVDEPGRFAVRDDGLAVDAADVPYLLACLDRVDAWREEHTPDSLGEVRDVAVRRDGDQVVIVGDVGAASLDYLRDAGHAATDALELTYAEVPVLRSALASQPE
ncbi:hypothetical protein FZ103_00240 [Streptomonospora sp. PA3]|uniref:hypothetical protein n=1 Tax=Streptomonospora sp. PA3 TaxID=2607326 RepID=UPI0012DD18FA|nr:hypothetical protein [Streptomonospora sp. PA3]MUL39622.1 hypothetical protein [Streptomonospora sp. PA3]